MTPRVIPAGWMPAANISRVVGHWTAGHYTPTADDRSHYHVLIDGNAKPVRGTPSIALNAHPKAAKGYAAHTLNCNTGSIGISICAMAGAVEAPFNAGRAPLTKDQWDVFVLAIADLCERYKLPVTHKTVLTHAEVQANLGIKQRGKWDIAILPFDPSFNTAKKVGDRLRAEVKAALGQGAPAPKPAPVAVAPDAFPTKGTMDNEVVAQVQRRLKELGYAEIGNVDGDFGDLTEKAILIFRHDAGLPLTPTIDEALLVAMAKAAPRKMADARTDATAKDVRKVVPEARDTWWSKVLAFWGMVGAFGTAGIQFVISSFSDAKALVKPIADTFGAVPWWMWAALIGGGLLTIWLKSKASEQKVVTAYQEGARR
jgi:hypothetical protein